MSKQTNDGNGSETPGRDLFKFFWEILKSIVIGVAAVFSFLANQNTEKTKEELERAKFAITQQAQQSEFDIKAYEFVEKTLSLKPAEIGQRGLAAGAIVNALTKPPLRDSLQNALLAVSTDRELNDRLNDAKRFDAEGGLQQYPPSPGQSKEGSLLHEGLTIPSAWAQEAARVLPTYRVDIFYCESTTSTVRTNERETRAREALSKLMKIQPSPTARVRMLPVLVQARPGYQSSSDEIRFNDKGKERQAAMELAGIIGIERNLIRSIDYASPGYISVFYCG